MHPIKSGICVSWDDLPIKDVFLNRLVPWHFDYSPREGERFRDCHAPIFEPFWGAERHFVLVKHQKNFGKFYLRLANAFQYAYSRNVNQGDLFTIFGDDDVERVIKDIEGVEYLYSERCEQ